MLALLTASLVLQQGAPVVAGRVLDPAGAPAAHTMVTLLHRPLARHPDAAREHRVVVATDTRGTWKATLRDGAVYSAWAATANGASAVEEGVDGGFVELRLLDGTGPRTVAVEGLDAWPEAATFRWRAVVGGENLDFVDVPFARGELTLPPLPPFANRNVELLRADGEPLWAASTAPGTTLRVPPPREHEVRVTDPAGAPIAGVEVLAHLCNHWATCSPGVDFGNRFRALWPCQGRTGGDGRLTVRLPERDGATARVWLLSRKDGWCGSLDGLHGGKRYAAGAELPAAEQPPPATPFAVVLERAAAVDLRVRTKRGEPLGVDQVYLLARASLRRERGSTSVPLELVLPITDGIARCSWTPPEAITLVSGVTTLAPAEHAALRARLGFAPPHAVRLEAARTFAADAVTPLDLDGWRELRVVTADGRPAARTVVALRSAATGAAELVRTDRLGRVAVPAAATRAAVLAPAGTGVLPLDGGVAPIELQLDATPTAAGAVLDADGAGVARATVSPRAREPNSPEQQDLALLLLLLPPATSGPDGRFTLLLPAALPVTLTIASPANGGATVELADDGDAQAPIEVRLPR